MVRVRFAPSPTGELHIGGARTALYNYLFARKEGGQFILRIEDTDRERMVAGSLERILANLRWLGLTWDEGPDVLGPYGPYVQSERTELYRKHAQDLVKRGAAYWCFCSLGRLDVLRQGQQATHQPTRYDRTCLRLTPDETRAKLEQNEPRTLRLKVPEGTTTVHDLIRGDVTVQNAEVDDQVLLKANGFPTYHLANVVDDHAMGITHVIRGEEWLPSTPKHLMLYRALGWEPPAFAHLPNVLNKSRAKLSKRKDGAAVWVATYREQGYLATALVNFLALLGWHPVDERELFTLAELCQAFDLSRAQKAGAIFDLEKLDWFNARYIRTLTLPELDAALQPTYQALAQQYGRTPSAGTLALTALVQPRLVRLNDTAELSRWYFSAGLAFDPPLLVPQDGTPGKARQALAELAATWERVGEWNAAELTAAATTLIRPGTFTRGELLWPARVALTGERQSPDVYGVAEALGRDESLHRLTSAWKLLA